ncbi:hypothetical protein RRG08_015694 [Elysia crispata]|uniref:Uncharacterized protein n=1 Tax=Elysia crispata TaxID=231223 RepID=A0AAE1CRF7_9GAST|nr:hypothetical protein RRG08_015694 [Elysia crispata]
MNTMLKSLVAIATIATSVVSSDNPEWDDLRVTWGPNFDTSFNQQPRTIGEAKDQGFELVGASTCNGSGVYNGFAYAKNDNFYITLLYDINGYIAGIQLGIPEQVATDFGQPTEKLKPPFNLVHDRYVTSAYFVDPSKICSEGRTKQSFDVEGTGTNLWLQNGTTPDDVVLIPKNQSDLVGTKWTEGRCFVTMGMHYWHNAVPDLDCETFFPALLLYNEGKLNTFGWVLLTEMMDDSFERTGINYVAAFMKSVPKCIRKMKTKVSTMHIYLTSTPYLNEC